MVFVCFPCLLFGINLYCNPGRPCPPHKGHSLFPWEKCSAHPKEKSGGTRADVAVARPSRRWMGYVQIVSDEQKARSGSHVCVRAVTYPCHGAGSWSGRSRSMRTDPCGPWPPTCGEASKRSPPRDSRLGGPCEGTLRPGSGASGWLSPAGWGP